MLSDVISPQPHEYTVVQISDGPADAPLMHTPRRVPAPLTLRHMMGFRLFGL
jgi:hypothetical protein